MSVLERVAKPSPLALGPTAQKKRRDMAGHDMPLDPLHISVGRAGGALADPSPGVANAATSAAHGYSLTPLSPRISVKQEAQEAAAALHLTSHGARAALADEGFANRHTKSQTSVKPEPVEPSLSSMVAAVDEVDVKCEHLFKIEKKPKSEKMALRSKSWIVDATSSASDATPHPPTHAVSLRQFDSPSCSGKIAASRDSLARQSTSPTESSTHTADSPRRSSGTLSNDVDMPDWSSHVASAELRKESISSTIRLQGSSSSRRHSAQEYGHVRLMHWETHKLDLASITRIPYPLERAKAKFDSRPSIIAAATENFTAPRLQRLPTLDNFRNSLKRRPSPEFLPGEPPFKRARDDTSSKPIGNNIHASAAPREEDADAETAVVGDVEMFEAEGNDVGLLDADVGGHVEKERLRAYKERVQRRRSKTPVPGSARPIERPRAPRKVSVATPKELAPCAVCSQSSTIEKNPRLAQSRRAQLPVTSKEPLAGMRMPCPLQHTFCFTCITKYIRRQLQPDNSGDVFVFPVRCPNCPNNIWTDGITDVVVNTLLFPSDLQLWTKRRATQPAKPMYCVNSKCKKPVKAGPEMDGPCGKCPACGSEMCISCRVSFQGDGHFGLSCIEYVAKYPQVLYELHKIVPMPPPGAAILELQRPNYGLPKPSDRGHIPRLEREDGIKPGIFERTSGTRRKRRQRIDEESDPEEERYDEDEEEEPFVYPEVDHELTWMDDWDVVSRKHEFTLEMFYEDTEDETGRVCLYCDAHGFQSIDELRQHLLNCLHPVFACCGRFFATYAGLNSHRMSTPKRFGKHICMTDAPLTELRITRYLDHRFATFHH